MDEEDRVMYSTIATENLALCALLGIERTLNTQEMKLVADPQHRRYYFEIEHFIGSGVQRVRYELSLNMVEND